jgi:hypothetical protein
LKDAARAVGDPSRVQCEVPRWIDAMRTPLPASTMKLYGPGNAPGFSEVDEDLSFPASDPVDPVRVRIHYRISCPKPLPDFFRGEYLCFVSERGKEIILRHFGDFARFSPTLLAGFGADNGKSWSALGPDESPFEDAGTYHVLHGAHVADILDTAQTMIDRDSLGVLPDVMPIGTIARLVLKEGVNVPPLFALPFQLCAPLFSEEFVSVLRKEKVLGFKPVVMFDTSRDATSGNTPAYATCDLISVDDALLWARGNAREPTP